MIEAGIVDPVKVTRSALQNAASVASMVLTTEAVVADKPEPPAPAPAAPDMGGMGGMGNISDIPVWLLLMALIFATVVGLLSGIAPANRAVKISALEAIRHE